MRPILCLVILLAACDDDDSQNVVRDLSVSSSCTAPNVLRYEQPGCDAKPVCGSAGMDLCARPVCSCTGKVLIGCDYYAEPFTNAQVPTGAQAGDSCSTD
jgi:hypothetical protein